jgi:hypothetical protein
MTKEIVYDKVVLEERGSWDDFVKQVDTRIAELKITCSDATDFNIELETSLGYYDSVDAYITLTYKRLETDKEYNARIEDERDSAERRKAYEKAEFERLKKKFGEVLKDNDL